MATHIKSLMALAKKEWFKTIIEGLTRQGYTKTKIAEQLGITPQRLTNISNGTFAISDKMIDTIITAFNLGDITLASTNSTVPDRYERPTNERVIDRLDTYILLTGIQESQVIVSAKLSHDVFEKARSIGNDLDTKEIKKVLDILPDLNDEWLIKGIGNMTRGGGVDGGSVIERKGPLARILELLNDENITLDDFAKSINSYATLFDNAIKWPYNSKNLILGNDKAIRGWVNSFCDVFPKYSKFWILTGKGSRYNYPVVE